MGSKFKTINVYKFALLFYETAEVVNLMDI